MPPTSFTLFMRERDELRQHFAEHHPDQTLPANDEAMVKAHAALHPEVGPRWDIYGQKTDLPGSVVQHNRSLGQLLDRLGKAEAARVEQARVERVTAAFKAMADDDFLAVVKEHGPVTASSAATHLAIPEARREIDSAKMTPKLTRLVDQGKIVAKRYGDLPLNVRRGVNGTYGATDRTWVYGLPEQFTALTEKSDAIKAEQERCDYVAGKIERAVMDSDFSNAWNDAAKERMGWPRPMIHGVGSKTVTIDVDLLEKLVMLAGLL